MLTLLNSTFPAIPMDFRCIDRCISAPFVLVISDSTPTHPKNLHLSRGYRTVMISKPPFSHGEFSNPGENDTSLTMTRHVGPGPGLPHCFEGRKGRCTTWCQVGWHVQASRLRETFLSFFSARSCFWLVEVESIFWSMSQMSFTWT